MIEAVPLLDHIKREFKGNISAAAKAHKATRNSIYAWIGAGSFVVNGKIYTPPERANKK